MGWRVHAAPAGHVCAHRASIEVRQRLRDVSNAERPLVVGQRARGLEHLCMDRIHAQIIHMYK